VYEAGSLGDGAIMPAGHLLLRSGDAPLLAGLYLEANEIRAEIVSFNLTLDPRSLDPASAALAGEALQCALAALDGGAEPAEEPQGTVR